VEDFSEDEVAELVEERQDMVSRVTWWRRCARCARTGGWLAGPGRKHMSMWRRRTVVTAFYLGSPPPADLGRVCLEGVGTQ
jgi:hypothetical protein